MVSSYLHAVPRSARMAITGELRCWMMGATLPDIRLTSLLGTRVYRGRFFYKCARKVDSEKCRKFIWEDQMGANGNGNQGSPQRRQPSAAPTGPAAAGRTTGFPANGGNVLGGRPSTPPPSSNASSSATEYSLSPTRAASATSSPSKRRRGMSPTLIEDVDEDEDETEKSPAWKGYQQRSASTSPAKRRTLASTPPPLPRTLPATTSPARENPSPKTSRRDVPALPHSQTVEEAIDEAWEDDISDFDDFEAGGDGRSPGKGKAGRGSTTGQGKFVSFDGSDRRDNRSAAPATPPRGLQPPQLPVTPTSVLHATNGSTSAARSASALPSTSAASAAKWEQIRSDTSSPFHARANALLGGVASPPSAATTPLLSNPSVRAPGSGVLDSPSAGAGAGAGPDGGVSMSPAINHLANLSLVADKLAETVRGEVESLTRTMAAQERQLKAMKQKAAYHEKKEKAVRDEMAGIKEKLRWVQAKARQRRILKLKMLMIANAVAGCLKLRTRNSGRACCDRFCFRCKMIVP